MYEKYLQEVERRKEMHGKQLRPPATSADLADLRATAQAELAAEVPPQYGAFLRLTDGLNHNGLFIYSSHNTEDYKHGFVDSNLDWRSYEINEDFLFFADADISLYVYSLVAQEYQLLDRPSMDIYGSFKTFDEMITEALKICIM